jgi:hypothetical protein
MSRHHWNIVNKIIENPAKKGHLILPWKNIFTILVRKINVPIDPTKGQGL